ncbi:hypothetical protein Tco_1042202 [Tanacetum coccineum]|uniref:Retrotransposon protein, putative, Ty1-copia subclass n=1 Tax=Tanacetum coccineum TaxID=301880 RepID=A0ABQ5GKJ9_9ASTR
MSITEAEYIAASEATMEVVWIRKFISGLGIVPTINEPIRMTCDNSAALYFANEPGVQKGARHYHMRYHYVRESIVLGEIRFLKVHTDDNLTDPFTKALSKGKLTQHARSMGLRLACSFMSMFEISGNNFNDWFLQLKMVLRVERKLFVIEQPISLASPTDSEYLRSGMRYMIHNEVACLMLGSMTPEL